jgi:CheY-like chemotaxis protein
MINKRLAGLVDGAIAANSALGQGNTFSAELPRVSGVTTSPASPAEADAAVHAAMSEQTMAEEQRCVLYIEDNQANLRLMRKMFSKRAHIVLCDADSAEVGLPLAVRLKPDLILLDINLPGIDGYQAIAQLRKMDGLQHIPVVAVTANVMKGDAERGMQAGFNAYVAKPLEVRQFLRQIDILLKMGKV